MSTQQNKATSRAWYTDVLSEGQLDLVDEIGSPTFVNHDPYAPPVGWPRGPEGLRRVAETYRAAFPDLAFTVEDQLAEGDRVVTRWTARGTQTGPLNDIPPTGRAAKVTGISIERFEEGKIIESHLGWDFLGLLQQLGVIPTPESGG